MDLTKVVYLNIDALSHRIAPMETAFDRHGVPMEARERFLGIDGADYASIDDLLDAAPAWLSQVRGHPIETRQGSIAVHWSQHRLYASLAARLQDTECALVLLDDTRIGAPWESLVQLSQDLESFDIVQLWPWDPMGGDNPNRPQYEAILESRPLSAMSCETRHDFTIGTDYPGDNALIVSASGAQRICEHFETTPWEFLEWGIMLMEDTRIFCSLEELREQWIEFIFVYEDSHRLRVDGDL